MECSKNAQYVAMYEEIKLLRWLYTRKNKYRIKNKYKSYHNASVCFHGHIQTITLTSTNVHKQMKEGRKEASKQSRNGVNDNDLGDQCGHRSRSV